MSTEPSVCCNLCGSTRHALVTQKSRPGPGASPPPSGYAISESHLEKPDKVVRCLICGLVYAIPGPSLPAILHDYETMQDPEYVREEEGRREQARIVLERLGRYKNGGLLLDIGCGPGFLLDEARKKGWEVEGLDLSEWAARQARERFGIEVRQGTLEESTFPERRFDAVVMNDVIEHLADPKAALRRIRRILKNDGVLYLSTPDIDSVLSRVLGGRWWGINKYHLYYFSKDTLEKYFSEVGFRRLRYASYPRVFSLRYWAKRLESYPSPLAWPFRVLARGAWADRRLKIVLHDQIDVVARKSQTLESVFDDDDPVAAPFEAKPKVIAVLPAYNAERTLERTVADIPREVVDEILLVDDCSRDRTVEIAKRLGLTVYRHDHNRGYGGNQKTCYERALEHGADIVVMVHPDYQYDPRIIPQLIEPIRQGRADAVFGSRMMKGGALVGGMPLWKHNANVLLTAFENVMLGTYLTEFHSGFRAYSARLLRRVRFQQNSDGFVFDTQIIVQALANRFKIEEIPIRTRYFEAASSIRLGPSVLYGLGIVREMVSYALHAKGLCRESRYEPASR